MGTGGGEPGQSGTPLAGNIPCDFNNKRTNLTDGMAVAGRCDRELSPFMSERCRTIANGHLQKLTSSCDGSFSGVFYACGWTSCVLFFSFRWA